MRSRTPALIVYLLAALLMALLILTAIALAAVADTGFGMSTPGGVSQ
jgi:hypothetical protein